MTRPTFSVKLLFSVACAASLFSCADNPAGVGPSVLTQLQRGVGNTPVAVRGGSTPTPPSDAVRATTTVTDGSSANPSIPASKSLAAQSLTAAATHVRHLLLENSSTGARALWVVTPAGIVSSASLGTLSTSWLIVGAGDFNADGFEDILWENTGPGGNGSRAIWLMNGNGGVVGSVNLGVVAVAWHIAGARDYDADGKDDILWENTIDGSRAFWLMNGSQVRQSLLIGTLSTEWRMVAAADLDSDGKPDILLENATNGNKVLWVMVGGVPRTAVLLGTLPLEWKLSASTDMDGDAHSDILLENISSGARVVWLEDGFGRVQSAQLLTTLDPLWHIAAALVPSRIAGGTVLFQEDFENGNLASRDWYDNTNVLLSTTEHVTGSNSSAQYRFPSGATSPTSGDAQRHKFTPSNSLYISYHVKYSTNWVGSGESYQPHEIYVLSNLDGDFDGPSENFLTLYLEHNYQNGGKPVMAMQDNKSVNYNQGALPNNLVGVTENRSTAGCNGMAESNMYSECFDNGSYWYNLKQLSGPVVFNPSPGVGYKNNWNFVEAYFQLNTIVNGVGQKDGVMQYWFNGVLVIDRHDILFRTGFRPTLKFNQFLIAPYIGDGSPVDQSMFMDNLRVGTARLP